eukprot:scaffold107095_cov35-Prasinocladus_malaysianus.AAC.1
MKENVMDRNEIAWHRLKRIDMTWSNTRQNEANNCYAHQIAIKSGIRQTITQAVDSYIERREAMVEGVLAQQKVRLASRHRQGLQL